MMHLFERHESQVRSYCRGWPTIFDRAVGSEMWDVDGRRFLDFFSGAGSLNYGHNHPDLKRPLLDYLERDGIVHSLDAHTAAKAAFLETFHSLVLAPRGLDYRVQFPGPTGTNAVEAALKLARKVKGRESVISFTNAFHGMTLGSLAVTGNSMKRGGAGVPLSHTAVMPFCNYLEEGSGLDYLDSVLADSGSGFDRPAAVIVETVQGEGGLNVASTTWLRRLLGVCRENDMLLIVDDVQMGCGRTGRFFSFEDAGIAPDIVCLSKSISGYGLPMALTLLSPELDLWEPGEHNGTFRGHNPAFVTARAALRRFWADDSLSAEVGRKAARVRTTLDELADELPGAEVRGRGLAQGLAFVDPDLATEVCAAAFASGLLLETSGPEGEVVKLMPPLTIDAAHLDEGLGLLVDAARATVRAPAGASS
jgi:diaminobutyrate-2-oxoglutarate transaminase